MQRAIVVGHIDNINGMATWCWEAARALHGAGRSVVLTLDEQLAGTSADFPVIALPKAGSTARRLPLANLTERLAGIASPRPADFFARALPALREQGIEPAAFLFNNGAFVDPAVSIPQFVVAWSYPTTLAGYLAKAPILGAGASLVGRVYLGLDLVRFWRSDWRSYREATGTLAVTAALERALAAKGVPATAVNPGTRLADTSPLPPDGPRRLLMAAENLDDERKGVRWMIEALVKHPVSGEYELLLAGRASDALRSSASGLPCRVQFLGQLPREALQALMARCDGFCFASSLDDWGYVLTEALANGLIPVAPDQSPFDEMVDKAGFLYKPRNAAQFTGAVRAILSLSPGDALKAKQAARRQAEDCFSSQAFAKHLLSALEARLQGVDLP